MALDEPKYPGSDLFESLAELSLDPQGRVVIPADVRRGLGLSPGEPLVVRVEDGRLIMEKRENVMRRLRARFAKIPPQVSLADELIADRRREVSQEATEENHGAE